MSTGNGDKDPAKTPKAGKEIKKITEIGKGGKVKEAFENKHGKGKDGKKPGK